MARIHTLNSISNPQPQPQSQQSVKDRYCPGIRNPFHLRVNDFNPLNRSSEDRNRRSCMLIVLGSVVACNVHGLFLMLSSDFTVLGFLIQVLTSVIGFFFLAGFLAVIGNAEGERMVAGKVVTRWHFDAFLMFCGAVYGALFLGTFLGLGGIAGFVLALVPLPMWVLIFGVAWVATWDPIPTSMA